MKSLKGKTALVTGAASGIGRATASTLASYGCYVCLADLDEDAVESIARDIQDGGGQAIATHLDVRDPVSNRQAMELSLRKSGSLDIVHLNAGVLFRGSVLDL